MATPSLVCLNSRQMHPIVTSIGCVRIPSWRLNLIKSVNSSSEWIDIDGSRPYVPPPLAHFEYPKNPYDGQMIYNFILQEVQIHVGGAWINALGHVNIGLRSQTEHILHWARRKMDEEQRLNELCEKYPALAEAREQFEAMKILVNTHDN